MKSKLLISLLCLCLWAVPVRAFGAGAEDPDFDLRYSADVNVDVDIEISDGDVDVDIDVDVDTDSVLEEEIERGRKDGRHSHTRLFPIVNYNRHGENANMKVVHVPGAAVVKMRETKREKTVKVVDVPLFTLIEHKTGKDGTFDNKFVKLPIVGSLFHHKRTETTEEVGILFFRHKRRIHKERDAD